MRSAQPITERAVMSNVGITATDLERRKTFVGLGPADVQRLGEIRELITRHVEKLVDTFFQHLASLHEAKVLLGYPELLKQARDMKRAHLLEMVAGKYDLEYVEQRIRLGLLYGRVG